MPTFEDLQIAGMSPCLLANRLKIPRDSISRICQKIRLLDNGCWEWNGAKSKGYGVVKIRSIRPSAFLVHRLNYQLVNGPIDDEIDAHHKVENGCIGPLCCNPDHIQAVTRRVHLGELSPTNIAFIHAQSRSCINGHVYTVETIRMSPEGRRCLICDKERAQGIRDGKLAMEGREKFRWKQEHKKTHCKRGHALTPDNLYWQGRYSSCLACRKGYHERVKASV